MRRHSAAVASAALLCAACEPAFPPPPAGATQGCVYVACGDWPYAGTRCSILTVDGREIGRFPPTGEAQDFIRRNDLRTCEEKR